MLSVVVLNVVAPFIHFLCLIDFLRCPWVPEQVNPLHLFIILPGSDALPRYDKNHNDLSITIKTATLGTNDTQVNDTRRRLYFN